MLGVFANIERYRGIFIVITDAWKSTSLCGIVYFFYSEINPNNMFGLKYTLLFRNIKLSVFNIHILKRNIGNWGTKTKFKIGDVL